MSLRRRLATIWKRNDKVESWTLIKKSSWGQILNLSCPHLENVELIEWSTGLRIGFGSTFIVRESYSPQASLFCDSCAQSAKLLFLLIVWISLEVFSQLESEKSEGVGVEEALSHSACNSPTWLHIEITQGSFNSAVPIFSAPTTTRDSNLMTLGADWTLVLYSKWLYGVVT